MFEIVVYFQKKSWRLLRIRTPLIKQNVNWNIYTRTGQPLSWIHNFLFNAQALQLTNTCPNIMHLLST